MLLHTHLTLRDGSRVRLRLPQGRDRRGVLDLYTRLGLPADPLEVQRGLRFDPHRRAIVCATRWTAAGEMVLGIGTITFGTGEIDSLVVDEELAPGLTDALREVLQVGAAVRAA